MTVYTDAFLQRVYLVELDPWKVSANATERLRVATEYFATGPADTPANVLYYGCIKSGPTLERSLYQGDGIGGRSIPARGSIELAIGDSPDWTRLNLLPYLDPDQYTWDGRSFTVWLIAKGAAFSTRVQLFSGTIDDIDYTETTLVLRLRDDQHRLDKPIQTTLYAGTGGDEGGDDIKGKEKPICLGQCFNVSPVLVDATDLLYQVHDGAISSITAVRDNGVPLLTTGTATAGGASTITLPATVTSGYDTAANPSTTNDYYNGAEIHITGGTGSGQTRTVSDYDGATRVITVGTAWSTQPDSTSVFAIDEFVKATSTGTFTLLAEPAGTITADVIGSTLGGTYSGTASDIAKYVAQAYGGLIPAEMDIASFTALNDLATGTLGYYVALETRAIPDVLDALMESVGGFYGFNRAGTMFVGRFDDPQLGTSALTVDGYDIVRDSIRREKIGEVLYKSTASYRPNWTIQSEGELAGSVPAEVKLIYGQTYSVTEPEIDYGVQTKHALAMERQFDTLLYNESDAGAENLRRFTIWSRAHSLYTFTAKTTPFQVDLDDVITVDLERLNLAGGKKARILRLLETPLSSEIEAGVFV